MVIRYLLECVSRDGRPPSALRSARWIIGSWQCHPAQSHWRLDEHQQRRHLRQQRVDQYGEGTNTQPTGKLSSTQASATFSTADFRFTVGRTASLRLLHEGAGGWRQDHHHIAGHQPDRAFGRIQSVSLLGSSATWSGPRPRPGSLSPAQRPCPSKPRSASKLDRRIWPKQRRPLSLFLGQRRT